MESTNIIGTWYARKDRLKPKLAVLTYSHLTPEANGKDLMPRILQMLPDKREESRRQISSGLE
jgi:hypothetical protein